MKYRWPLVLWMAFFSVGYALTFVHGFPAFKYYPVAHAWGGDGAFPDPGMAWFGKVAVGCLAGLLGAGMGMVVVKIKGNTSRPPWVVELMAWALLGAAALYTAHYEWVKWV